MSSFEVSFRTEVLLSLQDAMLDLVLPTLRGVAVVIAYPRIEVQCIYELVGLDERSATDDIEALVVADFVPPVEVVCSVVSLPRAERRVVRQGELWVYRRHEEEDGGLI